MFYSSKDTCRTKEAEREGREEPYLQSIKAAEDRDGVREEGKNAVSAVFLLVQYLEIGLCSSFLLLFLFILEQNC